LGILESETDSDGVFRSAGAVAQLIDVSCVYGNVDINALTTQMYDGWTKNSHSIFEIIDEMEGVPTVLGQHYFVTSASGALVPKWDFTSASFAGDENAYMIGKKVGDLKSPENPAVSVDWLQLNKTDGELAEQVYRIDTVNGQPAASVSIPRYNWISSLLLLTSRPVHTRSCRTLRQIRRSVL
jgi:hypothetical protein